MYPITRRFSGIMCVMMTSLNFRVNRCWYSSKPLPKHHPWGYATAEGTDPRHHIPNTGVIRRYEFSVSRGYISPDGYNKSAILINDQFPGPLVEANWGDTIEVTVTNNIDGPKEGTSIHWHGMPMRLTPWYDGTPSVQQCPIAFGTSFTYAFRAEVYGTSWYHTHFSAQYMDGAFGPMIIYGFEFAFPGEVLHDELKKRKQANSHGLRPRLRPYITCMFSKFFRSCRIVFMVWLALDHLFQHQELCNDWPWYRQTDYFHTPYAEFIDTIYGKPPIFLGSDNNLINGKMDLGCSLAGYNTTCPATAGISKFKFQPGKVHRLRLINGGACATQKFTIDDHEMIVIANDFVLVKPYTTKVVTLGAGQRTDVLVKATGKATDAVWMRSDLDQACFVNTVKQPHALAAIYYPEADLSQPPSTTATPWSSNNCANVSFWNCTTSLIDLIEGTGGGQDISSSEIWSDHLFTSDK